MKRLIIISFAFGSILAACTSRTSELKYDLQQWKDSTEHAQLSVETEFPVGKKGIAPVIRKQLTDVLDEQLSHIASYEGERLFPPYAGDAEDMKALLDYYRTSALAAIGRMAQEDADEREAYMREDDELTEERIREILADMPGWEYDCSIRKTEETDRYLVFLSQDYTYMGGAHGGLLGQGPLTFDKRDGHRIEAFFLPDAETALQPALKKGLLEYYSGNGVEFSEEDLFDQLFLEGDVIPLPVQLPYPTAEGLVLTYQQYEIASYADGMPSFVMPYEVAVPYLTDDAKDVLGR